MQQVDESKVKALESIFGGQDITASVIRTVLSSSDNKFDDAVDSLLNMTTSAEETSASRRAPQADEEDASLLDRKEREKIKTLENMFGSDLTNSVICTVLESNKGELVDTVDTLLNMTSKDLNPQYAVDNRKVVDRESERIRQEEDMKNYEEFKRLQIRLQEEEARAMKERAIEEQKRVDAEQRHREMLQEQEKMLRDFESAQKKSWEARQVEQKSLEAKQVEEARVQCERQEAERRERLRIEEENKREQTRLQQIFNDKLNKLKEEEESLRRAEATRKQEEDKRRDQLSKQEEELRRKAAEDEARLARLEEEKVKLKQKELELLAEEMKRADQRRYEEEQKRTEDRRKQEEMQREVERRRLAEEEGHRQKLAAEREAHRIKLEAERKSEELRLQLEEQRLQFQREKAQLEAAILEQKTAELRAREEAERKRIAIEEEKRREAERQLEEKRLKEEEQRRIEEEQRMREEEERQRIEQEIRQREEEEAKRLEEELKALELKERQQKEAHQLAYEQMAASAVFIPPKAPVSEDSIAITAEVNADTITCTWDLPEGNATPTNWLGLYTVRTLPNTKKYVQFAYTNNTSTGQHVFRGVTPGHYEVRFFATRGYEHAAKSPTVRVGPAATIMPQVQGDHLGIYYTLAPFSSTPTRDWIGVYEKGQRRNKLYLSTAYGNAEGQVMMKAPRAPGVYEVRLFASGAVYNDQAIAEFVIEDNDCVNVEPASVMAGANVNLSWIVRTLEPSTGDWIGLYRAEEANNSNYLSCTYTNGVSVGTATIAAPKEAGVYEFRLFAKAKGKYTTHRTSSALTVV